MCKPERQGEILQCFRNWDTNADGRISRDELFRVLQALNSDFSEKEMDALMLAIDENGNGMIEYNEFVNWMYGDSSKKGDISAEMKKMCNLVARHIAELQFEVSFNTPEGDAQSAKAGRKIYLKVVDNRCIKVIETTLTKADGSVETTTKEEDFGDEVKPMEDDYSLDVDFGELDTEFEQMIAGMKTAFGDLGQINRTNTQMCFKEVEGQSVKVTETTVHGPNGEKETTKTEEVVPQ